MKNITYLLLILMIGLAGCAKKDDLEQADNTKISAIVADNFNLSVFNTALVRTGLVQVIDREGPFTAIAPSDAAFQQAGFGNSQDILSAAPGRVAAIMNYHIVNGNYEFNKLPYLFNQEIRSANGGKLFVTHWVKEADTVLTINGSRVLSQNIKASNGLIQVIDRVLEPYSHSLITQGIASDRNLTLFYQAIQRAGLVQTLNGTGPFTVFAPNNAAMTAQGMGSVEVINQMQPADLARLMRYHIITDRRFVYDYILSTGNTNQSEQTMIDGNSITVKLIPHPQINGSFIGINLTGTGNTSAIEVIKQDVLTGNGVLHTIGGMLKITQ